jgi:hypothetical protein
MTSSEDGAKIPRLPVQLPEEVQSTWICRRPQEGMMMVETSGVPGLAQKAA